MLTNLSVEIRCQHCYVRLEQFWCKLWIRIQMCKLREREFPEHFQLYLQHFKMWKNSTLYMRVSLGTSKKNHSIRRTY